jgi:glucose-6-phosphate 1-dehydrogenase
MANNEKNPQIQNTPTAFVIFGATGDLARKRIFPALFKLYKANLLPDKIQIIAAARTSHSSWDFRTIVNESISQIDKEKFPRFYENIEYVPLDIAKDKNLNDITSAVKAFEKETGSCVQKTYYMAISPTILESSIENLGKNGLHLTCPNHKSERSKPIVIIEKPFGEDLASAKSLATKLNKYFSEDQIYRIDHYLGKETVQNIFTFRFGNEMFEPVWNNQYIDQVQITTAEFIGVEKRGAFYDKTGALRDIIQNHMLQLLSLVTISEPQKFDAKSIREQKVKIIKSIKDQKEEEIIKNSVRGQYEKYLEEDNVDQNSKTETYAMTRFFLEDKRWEGVPFYLRTGKRLTGKVTSIIIQFTEKGHKIFEGFKEANIPNIITIQIQPNEGIGIRLTAKKPGLTNMFEPVDMEFCYKTSFDTPQPDAYERLILDVIQKDQSLFISQQEVEESWKVVDPIEKVWSENKVPLNIYKQGSWGPDATEEILKKDGNNWLQPLLTICKI